MGYLAAADLVVAMAGYNTICEILSLQKRAVTVPRVKPVLEQLMRASCLARLGAIDTIHPHHLTPQLLARKVTAQLQATRPPAIASAIDLSGLETLRARLQALLADPQSPSPATPFNPRPALAALSA